MTPLLTAVDQGNYEVFRFLLEIYHSNDSSSTSNKVLPRIISLKCDKGESALLKAIRTRQQEVVYSLLHLGPEIFTYSVLKDSDSQGRNVLHYAVINQDKELIRRLVLLDADKSEMRNHEDSKRKTPQ